MTRHAMSVLRPALLWAAHFIALYALISAACAPRLVIDVQAMRALAFVVTMAAAILLLFWTVLAARGLRKVDRQSPERPLVVGTFWSALISLLAVLANSWPVATLSSCSGF